MYRVWGFLAEYSLLLILGALIALVWANTDPHGYHHFVETPLLFNDWVGADYKYWIKAYGPGAEAYLPDEPTKRVLSLHYLVNDVLMALFFAIAGKEVWEAVALKNGSLRGKKAATPLIATAGGMFGPIGIYLGMAAMWGVYEQVSNGWAVPVATDIAFAYLVGRIVFGAGHPAVRFLLLLAIADDAAGLIILAIFYPSGELAPVWLLLSVGAAFGAWFLFNWLPRRMDRGKQDRPNSTFSNKVLGPWPYIVAGCLSWYGFQEAGIHPALGLLPVIPAIPHADIAFGIFAQAEKYLTDLLNRMEHALKHPVEIILFMFGLANAGVEFSSMGEATWLVLLGLIVGKPVGIFLFGWVAARPMGLGLPEGMKSSDLIVIGFVAAIGFTVSLFIAAVAFDPGPVQDAAKMGALFSFFAAVLSIIAGKVFRVEKQNL